MRGIIDTKAMDIGRLPGSFEGRFAGLGLDLSRINHRCAPNVICAWHMPSFTFNITAFRPIKAGEQIFISYLPGDEILQPRVARIKTLQDKYAFTYDALFCLPCRENSATVGTNWRHGSKIELSDDHVIKRSSLVMGTMEREGVFNCGLWRYYYVTVCKAYCALKNELQARDTAERIMVGMLAKRSTDGGWSKVVARPQESDWWGLRA